MTTHPRRLSPFSLSIGLGVAVMLANLAASGSAFAAPPEEVDPEVEPAADAEIDADADADAESSEPAADDADGEAIAADESPAAPTGGDEQIQADDPNGEDPMEGGPVGQGREARPAGEKIQIPVDIGDKHSITYTSLLAARVNPLGLEERLWIGYQYRLYDKEKTILNGSNIGVFFRPVVSPAVALVGATLQVQPAAVLRLRATYSYVAYFGSFQYFQSFDSPHDDFSDTRLDAMKDAGQNYQTTGSQVELEALIQARYKNLVLRSTTAANYNMMNMRGGDDLFYAVRQDALVPNNGWVLYNDTDLIWLQALKGPRHASLLAGARGTFVMPFYPDSVYEPGDRLDNPNGPQIRVGPELGYIFYDRPDKYPRFNRPTLLVIPQWNVQHRWRSGRDVATAMPTTVIAFVFTGQLWGKN